MKQSIIKFINIFKPWFEVDSRSLGIFRIFLGILCFIDIARRWNYIDIFYTNGSIISASSSTSFYKMFTLLTSFTKSWEVYLFFLIGLFFSVLLIIGYRSKLSHIICAVVIISIHNRAIILENAGDMFFNSLLIWTIFLPLGLSYSIDALKKSLVGFKENTIEELNNKNFGINYPIKITSLAYFAVLLQISWIYFFTALNKTGYDWKNGYAIFKMYQLDTFLTPIGYIIRDYITSPISKLLTFGVVYLEYSIIILLFIPFYSYIFRTFAIIALSFFHIMIRLSVKVGLFSFTMLTTFTLLIDSKIYDIINRYINRYITKDKKYILFYDSDCGICHSTVRIIKRLDIFNRLFFADKNYMDKKPDIYNKVYNDTAILYNPNNNKTWLRHQVFGKILFLLPFGFLLGWIFFIHFLSNIFGYVYDKISSNRTKISEFFGTPACGLNIEKKVKDINVAATPFNSFKVVSCKLGSVVILIMLIISTFHYNLVANEAVNKKMTRWGFDKFKQKRELKRICYYPRMIQRWNMFAPTVLGTDKTIIVEATLYNGDIINPFTGRAPVLDSLDYKYLWKEHNQFWRKLFSRISKKNNKKYVKTFEKWLKKSTNKYFEENLNGSRIKSVKIWSLSQRNSEINSNKNHKVSKRLLNTKD